MCRNGPSDRRHVDCVGLIDEIKIVVVARPSGNTNQRFVFSAH